MEEFGCVFSYFKYGFWIFEFIGIILLEGLKYVFGNKGLIGRKFIRL